MLGLRRGAEPRARPSCSARVWQALVKSPGVIWVVVLNTRWKWNGLRAASLVKSSSFKLLRSAEGVSKIFATIIRRTLRTAHTLLSMLQYTSGMHLLQARKPASMALSMAEGKVKNCTCFRDGVMTTKMGARGGRVLPYCHGCFDSVMNTASSSLSSSAVYSGGATKALRAASSSSVFVIVLGSSKSAESEMIF